MSAGSNATPASAPAPADDFAARVEDLTKIYGSGNTEVVAVKHASFTVRRGEVVALLGPSGSGKSTLLAAVGLINPPTSGRIAIAGQEVMHGPRALVELRAFRRHHLGFVFQKANLIPFLSARQNVQVALEINDVPPRAARARADELLSYLGLGDRLNNLPFMLSGGQQQRVAIARALANRPGLILADEPTAALDGQLGRQVMDLFRRVAHEQRAGVIVVTHDHRSLDVFDRVLEMEDGLLRAHGASPAAA
jgi:putative ABC transport system ATP-binding protein